jgi:hypothetical protein
VDCGDGLGFVGKALTVAEGHRHCTEPDRGDSEGSQASRSHRSKRTGGAAGTFARCGVRNWPTGRRWPRSARARVILRDSNLANRTVSRFGCAPATPCSRWADRGPWSNVSVVRWGRPHRDSVAEVASAWSAERQVRDLAVRVFPPARHQYGHPRQPALAQTLRNSCPVLH